MASTDQTTEPPVCPDCGHENIPGAAFCAQCGQALADAATSADRPPNSDTQVTSVYTPIGPQADTTRSPWAPPADGTASSTSTVATAAPAVAGNATPDLAPAPAGQASATPTESIRGFVLGAIAVLIIMAIIGLYIYTAWIDDSTRNTVDDWLPWLS